MYSNKVKSTFIIMRVLETWSVRRTVAPKNAVPVPGTVPVPLQCSTWYSTGTNCRSFLQRMSVTHALIFYLISRRNNDVILAVRVSLILARFSDLSAASHSKPSTLRLDDRRLRTFHTKSRRITRNDDDAEKLLLRLHPSHRYPGLLPQQRPATTNNKAGRKS